jgi:hypothetical protein
MHHIDKIQLFFSTTVGYIPHTMHELHLVETQPPPHRWRQILKPNRYNSSQKITYHCAVSVSGNRLETILYIIKILVVLWLRRLAAQLRISLETMPLGIMVEKVALGRVSSQYIGFHLSA